MKFVMTAELVSLTFKANVCENYKGVACSVVPWPRDPQGPAPAASGTLVCSLVSCLSLDVNSYILWSEKIKFFSFVNQGGVVFMLCLLLWHTGIAALPLETTCSAETCQDSSKT